jgi:hypothetical protein
MKMEKDIPVDGFYLDDGTRVDPNLITKPGLCLSCIKDDDPGEEVLCILNRIDQQDDPEFKCFAYIAKV